MTPVFTLLIAFTFLDVLALLVFPFLSTRHTDSLWQDPARLGFLGASILSGLVFGILTAVSAERRNHTPSWFLAGHLGTFLAPLLAEQGMAESSPIAARLLVYGLCAAGCLAALAFFRLRPREHLSEIGPVLQGLGRFFHSSGNIWIGIGLLVLLIIGIFIGGFCETFYGGKAARSLVYTGWPFGILFLLFALSLVSATLRKFPFRVDQAGWLTVHAALVLLIIGSFMSYWGKVEGQIQLREGSRSDTFPLDTETRLVVEEVGAGSDGHSGRRVAEKIATFDLDPTDREPDERWVVGDGARELFTVRVDRYFADAIPRSRSDNAGTEPRLAIKGSILPPGGGDAQPFLLDEHSAGQGVGEMLVLDARRPPDAGAADALKDGRHRGGQGRLLVRDRQGKELLAADVKLKPRANAGGMRPAEMDLDVEIPGTGFRLKGQYWFDNYQQQRGGGSSMPVDASPGKPLNPLAVVCVSGPKGDDIRGAYSWYPEDPAAPAPGDRAYPEVTVVLDYHVVPEKSLYFLPEAGGGASWVYQGASDPAPRTGRAEPGQPVDLGIPLQVRVDEVFDRHRTWESYEFEGFNPERQAIRVAVGGAKTDDAPEHWLGLGFGALRVSKDDRVYQLRWTPTRRPFGFDLFLHEFHRDYYPGSDKPRTFESYLRLTHAEKFPGGVDMKIDMNHPLRLDGWRLYQSRFDDRSDPRFEYTILQVNRDPGLLVLYLACAVLTLGLVVVFFQKPFLRALGRWLERRNAGTAVRVGAGFGSVVLAFLGTLPGILVISLLPSGPAKGIGAVVVVAGLVLESLWVLKSLKPRLERSPAAAGVPGVVP